MSLRKIIISFYLLLKTPGGARKDISSNLFWCRDTGPLGLRGRQFDTYSAVSLVRVTDNRPVKLRSIIRHPHLVDIEENFLQCPLKLEANIHRNELNLLKKMCNVYKYVGCCFSKRFLCLTAPSWKWLTFCSLF